MYRILEKHELAPEVHEYVIEAPEIARAARPGQFIVLRLHERGERIPLTGPGRQANDSVRATPPPTPFPWLPIQSTNR